MTSAWIAFHIGTIWGASLVWFAQWRVRRSFEKRKQREQDLIRKMVALGNAFNPAHIPGLVSWIQNGVVRYGPDMMGPDGAPFPRETKLQVVKEEEEN